MIYLGFSFFTWPQILTAICRLFRSTEDRLLCVKFWCWSLNLDLFPLKIKLSCFMYPAMPSPGELELPWQTHTSPLLLLRFQPSTSAYSSDSDTKRHEEPGPGVNKQRMPLHVTPAWTDSLAGNWRSWKDGWKEQTCTYAWIHYIHTRTKACLK